MPTVPAKSDVALVTLRAPWLVGGDLLPGGIVKGRRGPSRVIARMELPDPAEWNGASCDLTRNQRVYGNERCLRTSQGCQEGQRK